MPSFCCPPNATTVRMELKTSSTTDAALAYAANSLLDVIVINCIEQSIKRSSKLLFAQYKLLRSHDNKKYQIIEEAVSVL